MTNSPERIGINPMQWVASDDGLIDPSLAPPLSEQLTLIREAGIRGVHTDVPAGMTTRKYGQLLADHGLAPAPGYTSVGLTDDASAHQALLERTARVSEQHAELGVPTIFLAASMFSAPERMQHPAVGHDRSPDRLENIRDLLAEVSGVIKSNGVKPAFHQHVGSWVETESETRYILDTIDVGLLDFGPDIGHLGWAGADYVGLIRDYAQRVSGLHIKDFNSEIVSQGRAHNWTYQAAVLAGVWAEPGQGSADINGALQELPPSFAGWLILEVDRGTQCTPEASIRLSAEWARNTLFGSAPTINQPSSQEDI